MRLVMKAMVRRNPIIVLTKTLSHASRRVRLGITDWGSLGRVSGPEHVVRRFIIWIDTFDHYLTHLNVS